MFVCTLRKGGLRKLAVVAVCGVVLAGAAITVDVVRNKGDAVDAAAQGGALSQQITGAQDVATFLQGYGVEVDPTTAEVSTVTVPRKWDDNFKAFNEVIKESGLDLSRVKNKKVDAIFEPGGLCPFVTALRKPPRPPPHLFGVSVSALFHLFPVTTLTMIHFTFVIALLS